MKGPIHVRAMLLDQSNHIIDYIIDTNVSVLRRFRALKYALSSTTLNSDGFSGIF